MSQDYVEIALTIFVILLIAGTFSFMFAMEVMNGTRVISTVKIGKSSMNIQRNLKNDTIIIDFDDECKIIANLDDSNRLSHMEFSEDCHDTGTI